jgi:hypothetical protein
MLCLTYSGACTTPLFQPVGVLASLFMLDFVIITREQHGIPERRYAGILRGGYW